MKRKQFHLSDVEEKMLEQMAEDTGQSEAEVVREAIRQYDHKNKKSSNILVDMAKKAEKEGFPGENNLSEEHDRYIMEIVENEK
ncbi:CopG family transcriptional regulator [Salibacterium halotolerans]|uniref:Ribbon-helix-helix protein, copG family n=1 Tax=Salibacterium halotolerans TaxID=1884432 RepID=A0A1I5VV64_9BACI|nr:CopG family transcriptional regulator [Salibacterium halotolerans]SFQ11293.1 Ribbon-helix-helix protein, copG family [Salibacterium halotolerans]